MGLEKVFIVILATGIAVFLALPFFRNRADDTSYSEKPDASPNPWEEKLKKLQSAKDSFYGAIKEIDFDYGLGKLSKEDYEELRKSYEIQAALILKQIDEITLGTNASGLDEKIEREIKLVRETRLTDGEEIEREIVKARSLKS